MDWDKVDKDDCLLAMERSPNRDIEIKHILRQALTDQVNDRAVFMKGLDASCHYEGYIICRKRKNYELFSFAAIMSAPADIIYREKRKRK